jgi:hypothetical protein
LTWRNGLKDAGSGRRPGSSNVTAISLSSRFTEEPLLGGRKTNSFVITAACIANVYDVHGEEHLPTVALGFGVAGRFSRDFQKTD